MSIQRHLGRAFTIGSAVLAAACVEVSTGVEEPYETPPCFSPAPLLGTYSPHAPGYIVVFHDAVDASEETARLAAQFSFTPRYVFTSALRGFVAELTPSTVAALRCQASVDYIERDAVISLD